MHRASNRRSVATVTTLTVTALVVSMLAVLAGPASAQERTFVSPLSGDQEVPPNASTATGNAEFVLNAAGTELSFRVDVENLENITQAHIHLAPFGANGPVVAWLYPPGPPAVPIPGMFTGTLAEGTLTAADLVGQLAGLTIQDLVEHLEDGNAYTNVHTVAFPPGEIRGQISEVEAEEEEEDGTDDNGTDDNGTDDNGTDDDATDDDATDDTEAHLHDHDDAVAPIERPTRVDAGSGGAASGSPSGTLTLVAPLVLVLILLAIGMVGHRHRAKR